MEDPVRVVTAKYPEIIFVDEFTGELLGIGAPMFRKFVEIYYPHFNTTWREFTPERTEFGDNRNAVGLKMIQSDQADVVPYRSKLMLYSGLPENVSLTYPVELEYCSFWNIYTGKAFSTYQGDVISSFGDFSIGIISMIILIVVIKKGLEYILQPSIEKMPVEETQRNGKIFKSAFDLIYRGFSPISRSASPKIILISLALVLVMIRLLFDATYNTNLVVSEKEEPTEDLEDLERQNMIADINDQSDCYITLTKANHKSLDRFLVLRPFVFETLENGCHAYTYDCRYERERFRRLVKFGDQLEYGLSVGWACQWLAAYQNEGFVYESRKHLLEAIAVLPYNKNMKPEAKSKLTRYIAKCWEMGLCPRARDTGVALLPLTDRPSKTCFEQDEEPYSYKSLGFVKVQSLLYMHFCLIACTCFVILAELIGDKLREKKFSDGYESDALKWAGNLNGIPGPFAMLINGLKNVFRENLFKIRRILLKIFLACSGLVCLIAVVHY